jgi:hypothetical protein
MNMMIRGHFVGDFDWAAHANSSTISTLGKAFKDATDIAMKVEERRAQIAQPGTLTPAGIKTEMVKWVQGDGGAVARAKVTTNRIRRELEQRRSKLALQGPDKTDVAGALLRQEIRSWLRSMAPSERTALVSMPDVDRDVALAVLEAPAALTGVTETLRENMIESGLQRLHPEAMKEIADIEEALSLVDNAVRAASKEIQSNLKMSEFETNELIAGTKFAKLIREVRTNKETGQPEERLLVNDFEKMSRRPATPDEIENGIVINEPSDRSLAA